jgi:hypothetical protein
MLVATVPPTRGTKSARSWPSLHRLGNQSRLGPTAIIVDSDVECGMVRMAEMLVEDVCAVRPFRRTEEAQEWLTAFPEGRG